MKYDPLKHYLQAADEAVIPLSFEQIEQILGSALPSSARRHAAWWSNNSTNHVNAQAWLAAGYRAERIDLTARRLCFRRAPDLARGVEESATAIQDDRASDLLERIWARLGGTVKVAEGVDLTAPTGEVWNAEFE